MKRKLNEQDVPVPLTTTATPTLPNNSFQKLGLDSRLLQAISREAFTHPTPVQSQAIPLVLEGKDILARAKTGSGKTAAYILPVLEAILRKKTISPEIKAVSALVLVPTRELANQVSHAFTTFSAFCAKEIRIVNLTQKVSDDVERALLADSPDVVIATPARAFLNLNNSAFSLEMLSHLVVDEADLVLSYGYEEDLQNVAKALPTGVQTMLMSATLSTEVETLKGLFLRDAVVLALDETKNDANNVSQYVIKCGEDEKFLLIYVMFKLKLIKGKCLVFVGDIDRCYRLKLYLEQFGTRSCVLNSELPVNSRIHVVEEFNKNVYDIIIASDEHEVLGSDAHQNKSSKSDAEEAPGSVNVGEQKDGEQKDGEQKDGEQKDGEQKDGEQKDGEQKDGEQKDGEQKDGKQKDAEDAQANGKAREDDNALSVTEENTESKASAEPPKKKRKPLKKDKEYGISRGIDFKNVACVLNFDFPTTSKSYIHRIGRTARAGRSGMALSFVVPSNLYRKHKPTTFPTAANDEAVLAKVTKHQAKKGHEVQPYQFDMAQVDAFRYRMNDALRAVTRLAVREARTRELRQELIKSEKLKRHFEENPDDLRHLRHDGELRAARIQPHLKHVPDYLMPGGAKNGKVVGKEIGFVGIAKPEGNRIRRARMAKKMGKGGKKVAGVRRDPLKTFSARARK